MAELKIEIGEIVQLRSGGPRMTIINISEGVEPITTIDGKPITAGKRPLAFCRWFDGANLRQAPFPFESLRVPHEVQESPLHAD